MNQHICDDIKSLINKFPFASGFDLYYTGFFNYMVNFKLSPEEIFASVENIIELHQDETINDQDKIKSFVRVLSKKMDSEVIGNLVLKVESNDEGRITMKDYFSQIMELIQKGNNKINKLECFLLGQFHAKNSSFEITKLFKYLNDMLENEQNNLINDEKIFEFFVEILNKEEKDHKAKENVNLLNHNSPKDLINNEGNSQSTQMTEESNPLQNSNQMKNRLKRRGTSDLGDDELKKMKKTQALLIQKNISVRQGINGHEERSDKKQGIDGSENNDLNPFSDLVADFEGQTLNSTNGQGPKDSDNLDEIPLEVLKFVEMEQQELALKRMNTKEEEELSKAFIAQLKEEEEKALQKAKEKLEEQNSANCAICLDDLYSTTFKPLEGCSHVFHEECMREYLKSKIDEKGFPILCPELECKSEIRLGDVADFMDETYREKFESFSFKSYLEKNANEVSCCPTADCPFAFIKEDDQSQLQCPVCKKHYCLNCRVEWHKGMTCKEFEISNKKDENDVKFEKFIKGQKFKQCPKCGFWVSRTEGCNAMTCRCGTPFCYHCGKEGDGHICPCLTQGQQGRRAQGIQPLFNPIRPAPAMGLFGVAQPQPLPQVQWRPMNNYGLGGGGLFGNQNLGNNYRINYPNPGLGGGGLFGNNNWYNPPVNPFWNQPLQNPPNLFYNNQNRNVNLNQIDDDDDEHLVGEEPDDADTINSNSDVSEDEPPVQRKKKTKKKKTIKNHPNALL